MQSRWTTPNCASSSAGTSAGARAIRASSTPSAWRRGACTAARAIPIRQPRKDANETRRHDACLLDPYSGMGRLPLAEALLLPASRDSRDRLAMARAAAPLGNALRWRDAHRLGGLGHGIDPTRPP